MPHYPDEVISYTRDDLLQALADELGSPADDPRILDPYDQIVSEWALTAEDPDAEYARYFRDGPGHRAGPSCRAGLGQGARPVVAGRCAWPGPPERHLRCYRRYPKEGRSY
jgi:hypothetical protein